MKSKTLQYIGVSVLSLTIMSLLIWSIWFIKNDGDKIAVFGVVAVVIAAYTSVLTVNINNEKAKQREYELLVLKEKQKVYEHFYNSLFESFNHTKKGKEGISNKASSELVLFKQGLMNWGSEELITKYIKFDNKLIFKADAGDNTVLVDADDFLKDLRKDMGFVDSKELDLISVILTPGARIEYQKVLKTKNG